DIRGAGAARRQPGAAGFDGRGGQGDGGATGCHPGEHREDPGARPRGHPADGKPAEPLERFAPGRTATGAAPGGGPCPGTGPGGRPLRGPEDRL
ncbi:MAG: Aspartyl-tRNA(Asn) amidotransferase subunit C @ Glutamyl-tRNA(Gln) amidotransferase subunit C, partial [uncultured Rubrobacteraceae bacterium]